MLLIYTEGVWTVTTQTGSDSDASTTSRVQLIVCGDKGDSGLTDLTPFDTDRQPFGVGQTDNFMVGSCLRLD